MSDEFAETLNEMAEGGELLEPEANVPTDTHVHPPRQEKEKYPEFHPEEFTDHPLARLVNSAGDHIADENGRATSCNLGESYAFCMDYYFGGSLENLPPYAYPIIATGHFAAVTVGKRALENATDPGESDDDGGGGGLQVNRGGEA